MLLRNDGNGADGIPRFIDVAPALGADDLYDSRGIAIADFDNDGDLDIAVNHSQGDNARDMKEGVAPVLLRNDIGSARNFIAIDLEGTLTNRQGIGAIVRIEAAGKVQTRLSTAGSSYASQHADRLFFGLDDATAVDRITVHWAGGATETFGSFPAGQVVHLVEGTGGGRGASGGG